MFPHKEFIQRIYQDKSKNICTNINCDAEEEEPVNLIKSEIQHLFEEINRRYFRQFELNDEFNS